MFAEVILQFNYRNAACFVYKILIDVRKIKFVNPLYLGFVLVVLAYFMVVNSYMLFKANQWKAIFPLLIQLIVLTLVLLRHRWVNKVLKGFALLLIIGPGLIFISQLIFMTAGANEKINYNSTIVALTKILMGVLIFGFYDSAVKNIDEVTEHKSLFGNWLGAKEKRASKLQTEFLGSHLHYG